MQRLARRPFATQSLLSVSAPLWGRSAATQARSFASAPVTDEALRLQMAIHGNAEVVTEEQRQVISAVTGTPVEHLNRKVRIYIPARCTMQSGVHSATSWEVSFPEEEKNHWANPLMGWTATKDPVSNLHLKFESQAAAIAYCKQQGLDYELEDSSTPYEHITPGKDYADNFKHKAIRNNIEPDIY